MSSTRTISRKPSTSSLLEYHLLDLPWSTVSRARERGRRPGGLPVILPPEGSLRTELMAGVSHAGR